MIVSVRDYSPLELKTMALATQNNGSRLILKDASVLNGLQCRSIAMSGEKGSVVLDFTDK